MKTFKYNKYGNEYEMSLSVSYYEINGNLAIAMYVNSDNVWEPWSNLTVNLDPILDKDCAYIDTNNNGEEIIAWIIRNRLAVPTGRIGYSGYCQYPEFRFHPEILQKIDLWGYGEYLNNFNC